MFPLNWPIKPLYRLVGANNQNNYWQKQCKKTKNFFIIFAAAQVDISSLILVQNCYQDLKDSSRTLTLPYI